MGKDAGTPAVVASGVATPFGPGGAGRWCATPSMTSFALSGRPRVRG